MKINRFIKIYRLKVIRNGGIVIWQNVSKMTPLQKFCYLQYLIKVDTGEVFFRNGKQVFDAVKQLRHSCG